MRQRSLAGPTSGLLIRWTIVRLVRRQRWLDAVSAMLRAQSRGQKLLRRVCWKPQPMSIVQNFHRINKLVLAAKEGTGDENVVRYGIALNTFVNAYARAQGNGGNTGAHRCCAR